MEAHNSGEEEPLEALLRAEEDDEHCLIIAARRAGDTFVLLGSNEPVVAREYENGTETGALTAVTVGVPVMGETGLIALALCAASPNGSVAIEAAGLPHERARRLAFVFCTMNKLGSPRATFADSMPVSGCIVSLSSDCFLELCAGNDVYTSNPDMSKARTLGVRRFVPIGKLLRFLLSPSSLPYLAEAALCAHFEAVAREQSELLEIAVKEMLAYAADNETQKKRILSLETSLVVVKRDCERLKENITRMENDVREIQDEFTASSKAYDADVERLLSEQAGTRLAQRLVEEQLDESQHALHESRAIVKQLRRILKEAERIVKNPRRPEHARDRLRNVLAEAEEYTS